MSYDKKDLLRMYKKMWEIRECDDRLASLKLKDLVMNGFHPYRGEEAVSAGSCDALIEGDYLVSTHRPQGHAIAKGTSMKKVFCELLGRMGGMSNGLGGPMQWVEAEENFFCGSIVGSGVSYATGFGLALKMKKSKNICLCIFGDGASNTGAFHEGMNLASVWKLPIVFVCENNQYGEAMPVKKFVPVDRISKRAASYGIEGITVDGMDVLEVASAVSVRIEAARSGKGPQFVEALTYRFKGHYMGDPDNYRTKEEIEEWRKRDPIEKARKQLVNEYGLSEKEMKEIEDEITQRCDEEKEWALQQPKPTLEYAVSNVMIPINGKGA
jgi:TPP-dependent pyruvate/acetoin dehydrogenase alpha subunit